jgi:hypothetical protein
VELLFSFIHAIVEGELVQEGAMVSVRLLFVLQVESGHLYGSHLFISQLRRLDSTSIDWRFNQSERFF